MEQQTEQGSGTADRQTRFLTHHAHSRREWPAVRRPPDTDMAKGVTGLEWHSAVGDSPRQLKQQGQTALAWVTWGCNVIPGKACTPYNDIPRRTTVSH